MTFASVLNIPQYISMLVQPLFQFKTFINLFDRELYYDMKISILVFTAILFVVLLEPSFHYDKCY